MQNSDKISLIIAVLSGVTVLVAWIFRYKIAELGKKNNKNPSEVLFEGYEKLLKSYQEAIVSRDGKITKLEADFDKIQYDLNSARLTIQELKSEDDNKTKIIDSLELKLNELKLLHKNGNGV